jgi:hypothetical protein
VDTAKLTAQCKALMKAGKKDRAILMLKLRKQKEAEFVKADAQVLNLEELIGTIEWEKQQQEVIEGLAIGNATLKKMHEQMSVEDVEKLMEETSEAQDMVNEISELLASGSSVDESECLEELAALELEQEQLLGASVGAAEVAQAAQVAQAAETVEAAVDQQAAADLLAAALPAAPGAEPEVANPEAEALRQALPEAPSIPVAVEEIAVEEAEQPKKQKEARVAVAS